MQQTEFAFGPDLNGSAGDRKQRPRAGRDAEVLDVYGGAAVQFSGGSPGTDLDRRGICCWGIRGQSVDGAQERRVDRPPVARLVPEVFSERHWVHRAIGPYGPGERSRGTQACGPLSEFVFACQLGFPLVRIGRRGPLWYIAVMALVRSPRRLDVRFCLACGHDGPELQGGCSGVFVCEVCGADLYARPPRSYRELEGLDEVSPSVAPRRVLARLLGAMARLLRPRQGR